ncbi:hypothetical protein [Caballeronia sp. dw_19]|uniref:hypothetical protein n=1 Tax=Caballeronia sp. dw_19 TaxID=2719791 RepID=UPI001BCE5C6E|nr:hypothetical protein [Caballeronia sp. dw_19]
MIKILNKIAVAIVFAIAAVSASAQFTFTPGQVLGAAQLNSAFEAVLPLSGGALSGPLSVPGLGVTGSITSPIIAGGALTKILSNSSTTGQAIYTGLCAGCTAYDGLQSTITIPAGTTVTGSNAVSSYIVNKNPSTGVANSGNGVNYFSVQTCAVNNGACWTQNGILSDNSTYAISAYTGVQLNVAEYDIDVTSPYTNVQGPTLTGSSLVQPAAAVGFTIGSLSVQDPTIAKWTYGFVTQDGVANTAFHAGALSASGTSIASQPITYNYYDSTSTVQAWSTQVQASGNFVLSDSGSAHQFQVNAGIMSKSPSGTGSVTIDNAGGQESVLSLNDGGANKWQIGKLNSTNCFFAYDTVANNFVWEMCSGGTFAFTSPVSHAKQEIDASYTYSTPTTGATVTLATGTETAVINPAGTLSALTVTLPSCQAGYDGSIARYSSSQQITALTVNATAGSVSNAPTTLAAGAGHANICRVANATWYPLY